MWKRFLIINKIIKMYIMEKFLCQECNNQLKLKKSNFIFSFNAECCNNHKKENVDLEDLLNMKKSNQDIFKCKNHKKKEYNSLL